MYGKNEISINLGNSCLEGTPGVYIISNKERGMSVPWGDGCSRGMGVPWGMGIPGGGSSWGMGVPGG